MPENRSKRAVLGALRVTPDLCGLSGIPALDSDDGHALLRWMDRSGLALYAWRQLQRHDATEKVPREWRQALQQRLLDNASRTEDLLMEFCRLNAAFERRGVRVATMKGFTLVPDFCEEPALRHQTDFDFLVRREDMSDAAEVLRMCGYNADRWSEGGETCFTTVLHRVPSADDYLYSHQHQRQVDLHVSLWEPSPWLAVETPTDSMSCIECRVLRGTWFSALSPADSFLNQVLHVFRHSMKSWIRLSWLLELGHCMELHRGDAELWQRVTSRAGQSELTKKAFAFVLGLVGCAFGAQTPKVLEQWLTGTDTARLRAWIEGFGLDWVITDWPGSLSNLLIAQEFIPDPKRRASYSRSRLWPGKATTSIGTITTKDTRTFAKLQLTRVHYLLQRTSAHVKDLCDLPMQRWRWRRALESARKGMVETNS